MGKKAQIKKVRRSMRRLIEAGHTPVDALQQAYVYDTPYGYRLGHRSLRRMLPDDMKVRVTRVRRDESRASGWVAYGELVVQVGSLVHRASQPNEHLGLILLDGAVSALRLRESGETYSTAYDQDDIDTETFEPVEVTP